MKKEVHKRPGPAPAEEGAPAKEVVAEKKTILIFSPDTNFCLSLSMLFQDRYNVVTTTDLALIEELAADNGASLAIVDEVPSDQVISAIDSLHGSCEGIPVVMLYVYNSRDVALDRAMRSHADAVFYKPVEISAVSKCIDEILCQ